MWIAVVLACAQPRIAVTPSDGYGGYGAFQAQEGWRDTRCADVTVEGFAPVEVCEHQFRTPAQARCATCASEAVCVVDGAVVVTARGPRDSAAIALAATGHGSR